MISIQNLTKTFDKNDKPIFENFNLEIKKGEFVIFSGASGCGKTTLLNMIGAIEPITTGHIYVNDIDISLKKNQLNYFKDTVSFIFQNFALIDSKTVLENMNLVKKQSRTDITIEQALTNVGLLDKLNTKVYKLSGGEQQRIALARIMIKKCDLILADEPTGSLDLKNAQLVIDILTNFNKQGKTIIMVTHDNRLLEKGSRVIYL